MIIGKTVEEKYVIKLLCTNEEMAERFAEFINLYLFYNIHLNYICNFIESINKAHFKQNINLVI